MTPEGKLKSDCRAIAIKRNLWIWSIEGKSINGIPDTICSKVGGGVLFAEFKRPDGKGVLSVQQVRRIGQLQDAGAEVHVISSVEQYELAVGIRVRQYEL